MKGHTVLLQKASKALTARVSVMECNIWAPSPSTMLFDCVISCKCHKYNSNFSARGGTPKVWNKLDTSSMLRPVTGTSWQICQVLITDNGCVTTEATVFDTTAEPKCTTPAFPSLNFRQEWKEEENWQRAYRLLQGLWALGYPPLALSTQRPFSTL